MIIGAFDKLENWLKEHAIAPDDVVVCFSARSAGTRDALERALQSDIPKEDQFIDNMAPYSRKQKATLYRIKIAVTDVPPDID